MQSQGGLRAFLWFWIPLSANWFMMGLENPIVASFISEFPNQKNNLAAFGVAFSLGLFVEAPIIMMLSASNALVQGRENYLRLRNFNTVLCVLLTIVMAILPFPGVWNSLASAIGLSGEQAEITRFAVMFLLPWPAAIGIRRFYHGLLIHAGKTAAVAWGTLVRLFAMLLVAFVLSKSEFVPPYCLGTAAVSTGVVAELLYAWWLSRERVQFLLRTPDPSKPLTNRQIFSYYFPLAMTPVITFAVAPVITLFMGRFPLPLESMAVYPLVTNFVFLVNCPGLSLQEVFITWFAKYPHEKKLLARITAITGIAGALLILVVASSSLKSFWFGGVAGLPPELLALVGFPLAILSIQALSNAMQSWQRAHLISVGRTQRITHSAMAEVGVIVLTLTLLLSHSSVTGVTAAAMALVAGRIVSIAVAAV
jgi:hypothetical protein